MRLEVDNKKKKTRDVASRCDLTCKEKEIADVISYVIKRKARKLCCLESSASCICMLHHDETAGNPAGSSRTIC
eukprot:scaffold474623_cov36-Prasinocladus_malaysianus.AAC.2